MTPTGSRIPHASASALQKILDVKSALKYVNKKKYINTEEMEKYYMIKQVRFTFAIKSCLCYHHKIVQKVFYNNYLKQKGVIAVHFRSINY